jgi:hypothetical protein
MACPEMSEADTDATIKAGRIGLIRWLHPILNRDGSKRPWVRDAI